MALPLPPPCCFVLLPFLDPRLVVSSPAENPYHTVGFRGPLPLRPTQASLTPRLLPFSIIFVV